MKSKILFVGFLLIISMSFVFFIFTGINTAVINNSVNNLNTKQLFPPQPTGGGWGDKYYIGAIQDEQDWYHNPPDGSFGQIDLIGFNLWHSYVQGESVDNRYHPKVDWQEHGTYLNGHITTDNLMAVVSTYSDDVNKIIDDIYLHNGGRKLIMPRPKIEWLCYGQRSDYQCEYVPVSDQMWFYAFNSDQLGHIRVGTDIDDNTQYGNGARVKACLLSEGPNNGGYVVDRLRANDEQCRRAKSIDYNQWQCDNYCYWLIKPRIRADKDFVNNPLNAETPICRIDVFNQGNEQGGTKFKEVILKARNFKPSPTQDYDGYYKEEFNFIDNDSTLNYGLGDWATDEKGWGYTSRGSHGAPDNSWDNHADIQIYWYANCDAYFDYVRVDNDVADELFNINNPNHLRDSLWIRDEVQQILAASGKPQRVLKCYLEYVEYNNIPCIGRVNERLKYWSNNTVDIMQDLNGGNISGHVDWAERDRILNPDFLKSYYVDKAGYTQIFAECYPLDGCFDIHPSNNQFSVIPSSLPTTTAGNIFSKVEPPGDYDAWLEDNFNHQPSYWEGGDVGSRCSVPEGTILSQCFGQFRSVMQCCNAISRSANIPFIFMPPTHQWFVNYEVHREPLNEELNMMANVAVSYGAKGLMYWEFPSEYRSEQDYGTGITDLWRGDLRTVNYYGQGGDNDPSNNKWQIFKNIVNRVSNIWGPYLLSFDNTQTKSYMFNRENGQVVQDSYFADVVSYNWNPPEPCVQDNPGGINPEGMAYECVENRYVQLATFKNSTPGWDQFFMIVNRRCAPTQTNHVDGQRFIRVRFNANSSAFPTYINWKIINLYDNSLVTRFDKTQSYLLDLGMFEPGEGRLYKITPVIVSGGTLEANENISNTEFTCLDTVYGNGHNIKFIGNQNTINFSDSGMIIMNGGTFQTDSASDGPQQTKNKFQAAVGGHKWGGLQFTGCNVKMYNSDFSGVSSPEGGNYALSCINCPLIDVRFNNFTSSSDTAGGISIAYTGTTIASCYNYVMYNTFNMNNSYSRAVQVQGFGGNILGTYINGNTINSNGAATGILVSTVTGGVIKNNLISGCGMGINTIFSSCDVYGNTISSTINNSIGIQATDQSIINIQPTDGDWLGGINSITNGKGNSINLILDNSVFSSEGGYNVFEVDTSGSSSPYHIYGSFWESDYNNYTKATNNCFMISGNTISDPLLPLNNVMDQYSNNINLNFNPYNCNTMVPNGSDIVDVFNGVYDTILTSSQGGGKGGMFVITPKQLYDSICISFRHRSYVNAKTKCMQLLNTYPDSSQSIAALRILYLASILTDTSYASNSALKTYYETLILNHGNNNSLVDICNYLVQKCKVLLHQYSSALTGFQSIINNNQYNYEGLLARWDFMATSLLMNGGGGGEPMYRVGFSILDLQADEATDDNGGPKDKSPFTKDQRKIITGAVNKTFETNKDKDEEKIKSLTKQVKNGDDKSKKELNKMTVLKDVIKSEQPKNIMEHLKIVNNDIKKVFGGKSVNISKDKGNNIPQVFSISQNFPNPFNPTTTIRYALPKDVKVTIKIYDILGKLVTTLVNGELKKAGFYEAQFDGTNFASGVYFYRIEADKFVQSKKMVLVK